MDTLTIQVMNGQDMSSGVVDVQVPMFFARDCRLLKVICDDFEEDDEQEPVPVFVPKIYLDKILEYYTYYTDYFLGKTQIEDKDRFQLITQSMLDFPINQTKVEQDRAKRIPRRPDIPTEVFYVGVMDSEGTLSNVVDATNMTTLELANRMSLKLDYMEWWTNKFERLFIRTIHFIPIDATHFPNDGISFESDGTTILSAFLLLKYADYLLSNSFSRFIRAMIHYHIYSNNPTT